MAGIKMTNTQRSKLLEALLQQQTSQNTQSQTLGEALLRIGEAGIRAKQIKGLQKEEAASQQKLTDALSPKVNAQGQMPLEQVDGLAPLDPIQAKQAKSLAPGGGYLSAQGGIDTANEKLMYDAISKLPVDQQVQAAQVLAMRKEMKDPSKFNQAKILAGDQREHEKLLQANQFGQQDKTIGAQHKNQLEVLGIQQDFQEMMWKHDTDRAIVMEEIMQGNRERMARLQADLDKEVDVANILAKAELEGVELSEAQGKAVSWYTKGTTALAIMEKMEDEGYVLSPAAAAAYTNALTAEGGFSQQAWRNAPGLNQRDLNYLDAVNMLIDGAIRQATGAAVKDFEWGSTFASLTTIGKDPNQILNKRVMRKAVLGSMAIQAGPAGVAMANRLIGDSFKGEGYDEAFNWSNPDEVQLDAETQKVIDAINAEAERLKRLQEGGVQ